MACVLVFVFNNSVLFYVDLGMHKVTTIQQKPIIGATHQHREKEAEHDAFCTYISMKNATGTSSTECRDISK